MRRLLRRTRTEADRGHSVGYFSGYYRGLECLLRLWPAVRARVPNATLEVYYGWSGWEFLGGDNEVERGRLEALRVHLIELLVSLREHGVSEHGRVSHQELAAVMLRTKVWAYPTEFLETHCITALKAQQAGCIPVVTAVGALRETVRSGRAIECADIYSNPAGQASFVDALVEALLSERPSEPVMVDDWSDVAARWVELFE